MSKQLDVAIEFLESEHSFTVKDYMLVIPKFKRCLTNLGRKLKNESKDNSEGSKPHD